MKTRNEILAELNRPDYSEEEVMKVVDEATETLFEAAKKKVNRVTIAVSKTNPKFIHQVEKRLKEEGFYTYSWGINNSYSLTVSTEPVNQTIGTTGYIRYNDRFKEDKIPLVYTTPYIGEL